jgi:hypothetical protein
VHGLFVPEAAQQLDGDPVTGLGLSLHICHATVREKQVQPPGMRPRSVLWVLDDPTRQLVESIGQAFPA